MSAGQRVRRAVAAAGLAVAVAVTLIGATIGPAAAARQHLNGASQVGWQLDNAAPGAIWNVDQIIQLPKTARSSYWALQWSFAGGGDVGYMASRPTLRPGPTAAAGRWRCSRCGTPTTRATP